MGTLRKRFRRREGIRDQGGYGGQEGSRENGRCERYEGDSLTHADPLSTPDTSIPYDPYARYEPLPSSPLSPCDPMRDVRPPRTAPLRLYPCSPYTASGHLVFFRPPARRGVGVPACSLPRRMLTALADFSQFTA